MLNLLDSKYLKEKNLKILNSYDIFTVSDLLKFFPKKYEIYHLEKFSIDNLEKTTLLGTVLTIKVNQYKSVASFYFDFRTDNFVIRVVSFNKNYLLSKLSINQKIVITGKFNKLKNNFNLDLIFFNDFCNHIKCLYNIDGIGDSTISKYVKEILADKRTHLSELLPTELIKKYGLFNSKDFLYKIHFPQSKSDIKNCFVKLKYIEALNLYLTLNFDLFKNKMRTPKIVFKMDLVKKFIDSLDFDLTKDQKKTVNEIFADFKRESTVNRIIEADVGSGKTIIVIIASFAVMQEHQVCYVAPTESLANQVYKVYQSYFGNQNIRLLTSSTKPKDKNVILNDLQKDNLKVLISTHSAFNSNVKFKDLRLIILDEEQRFGFKQKNILQERNKQASVILLSATPIPKTLAKTILNDYEISRILEKPIGRKKINTKIINEEHLTEIYDKIYEELKLKHQVYIICPLINKNEKFDKNNIIDIYNFYKEKFLEFGEVDYLHGKLNSIEKEEKLERFYTNKTSILISTTVVEVGIDNKNATMIVIYNSEQFGLSTLHQLRGRVGRNNLDSYCYFISFKQENERLKILEKTDDCFELSEFDLKYRGPGEFLGLKQSGKLDLKYVNFFNDIALLKHSKEDGMFILKNDLLNKDEYKNLKKYFMNFKSNFEI